MNKYKIIENNGGLLIDTAPDYQKFMESEIEIESYSKHEAVCSIYDNSLNTWRQCYVLDTDTLRLFLVYWYRDSMDRMTTTESFHSILEKPKAKNKYKIIPNQNKHPDSITYEFMNSYFTVESDSPVNAFRKYCEHDSFVLNLDSNFGYVFDTESLDLYYTSWSVNEQLGNSSFVKKLEKPFETDNDLNMKYKYKIISNRYNSTPSYDEMMKSDVLINATGPKTALSRYRHLFDSRVKSGWTLNLESLNLHQVIFDGQKEYVAHFIKKLEKSKMNTFKILITPKTPTLEVMLKSGTLVEAESAQDVYDKYFTNYSKFNTFRILNLSNLELTSFTYNQHKNCISFCVEKLEKPMTKPKLNTLSFKTLTEANNKRLPLFKNSKGLPAHSKPDGSDWSHAEWLQAVIGELGEYANIMKKVQRGDLTMEEAKPSIEKELADVQTYFSILAQQLNIDLGQAVEDKFNEVSKRVECDVFIENDKVVTKSQDSLTWKGSETFKAVFVNHDKDGTYANRLIGNDSLLSKKEELKTELDKIKIKPSNSKKPVVTPQMTNLMIGVGLAYLANQFYGIYPKPAQKFITLQDLNNGKVYTRPFVSGQDSTTLQELSKLIVTDATVMKTLLNGKDYDGFNVNVGDMIQFSDDRNVLYSLRVTKIE